MSVRTHDERYPRYSPKSIHGQMPKWIRQFAWRRERRITKDALREDAASESLLQAVHKKFRGIAAWMWY